MILFIPKFITRFIDYLSDPIESVVENDILDFRYEFYDKDNCVNFVLSEMFVESVNIEKNTCNGYV